MLGQSKRGFAAMNHEKQRAIASKGGRAAHHKGTAHEFTPEEAREAGRLGGKTVGENRAHMAAIGRKGGQRAASSSRKLLPTSNNEGTGQFFSQQVSPRATDLLRTDHRKVNGLFHQQEMSRDQDEVWVSLVYQICAELDVHTQLEEELFYPAVKAKVKESVREKIDNGIKEHQHMKDLITQLRQMTEGDASFAPTVQQLRESVEHHVQEEEQEILPAAEEQCGEDFVQLGAEMERRKQNLMLNSAVSQRSLGYPESEAPNEPPLLHEPLAETSR